MISAGDVIVVLEKHLAARGDENQPERLVAAGKGRLGKFDGAEQRGTVGSTDRHPATLRGACRGRGACQNGRVTSADPRPSPLATGWGPPPAAGRGYVPHWEADILLADGQAAHLRPLGPRDEPALETFWAALSPKTQYFRFFAAHPSLKPADRERFLQADHQNRVVLGVFTLSLIHI